MPACVNFVRFSPTDHLLLSMCSRLFSVLAPATLVQQCLNPLFAVVKGTLAMVRLAVLCKKTAIQKSSWYLIRASMASTHAKKVVWARPLQRISG